MTEEAVIDVQHLRKTYGATVAVADVSSPSGAGRSDPRPQRCREDHHRGGQVGLRPVDAGNIRVLGLDPHRDTWQVRDRVGVQLQQARLPARLRVGEAWSCTPRSTPILPTPAELLERSG